jgi:hypothetical protein
LVNLQQQTNDPTALISIQAALDRNANYQSIWQQLQSNINNYLPDWLTAETASSNPPPEAYQSTVVSPSGQETDISSTTTMTTTGGLGRLNRFRRGYNPRNLHGLGVIPLLIGAAALAALAYVVTKGLQLLKDSATEDRIISDLESGNLTSAQASALLPSGIQSAAASFTGLGLTSMLAIGAVVVGLIFWSRR